jgi:hypothetical protein
MISNSIVTPVKAVLATSFIRPDLLGKTISFPIPSPIMGLRKAVKAGE